MSYTAKRKTVEAIKVSDALAAQASEPSWLQAQLDTGWIRLLDGGIEVRTAQGLLTALPDDYIVLDNATGQLSIMTASTFEKMYEAQ
jgi:hypothetical protein